MVVVVVGGGGGGVWALYTIILCMSNARLRDYFAVDPFAQANYLNKK